MGLIDSEEARRWDRAQPRSTRAVRPVSSPPEKFTATATTLKLYFELGATTIESTFTHL